MYNPNNLILRSTSSLIIFVLLGFAIYLLIAGHNSPGGGFVYGLVTSVAILLLNLVYDDISVKKILPIIFISLIPICLLIATLTGLGVILFDFPFLTHTFGVISIPLIGNIEIATAMFFDIGVYVTVLGTTMTIILHIAFDRD